MVQNKNPNAKSVEELVRESRRDWMDERTMRRVIIMTNRLGMHEKIILAD